MKMNWKLEYIESPEEGAHEICQKGATRKSSISCHPQICV